jgi:hypothetical protein
MEENKGFVFKLTKEDGVYFARCVISGLEVRAESWSDLYNKMMQLKASISSKPELSDSVS